jgi:hypothetical protein
MARALNLAFEVLWSFWFCPLRLIYNGVYAKSLKEIMVLNCVLCLHYTWGIKFVHSTLTYADALIFLSSAKASAIRYSRAKP